MNISKVHITTHKNTLNNLTFPLGSNTISFDTNYGLIKI